MAVARAGSAESERLLTTDPWTFDYTPAGTPRGIVVAVVHGATATRHAQSVTYGGVSLALIVEAADTANEPGNASLWFLGSSIPTGTQTISVDLDSATADDIHFVVWELSGSRDLEVIDFDELNENAANPTVTLQSGGRVKISICAMYGGGAAPGGTLATGNTLDHTFDIAAFYSQTCYETTVDNADHTIGWSTLGTDDLALVAIAVAEVNATQSAAGGITPTGAQTRKTKTTPDGTIATITGTQTRKVSITPDGAISTLVGTLTKVVKKPLAGVIATITSTLGTVKVATIALSGAISSIVGTLVRKVTTAPAGSITPTGQPTNKVSLTPEGTVTSQGALTKKLPKVFTGDITTSGSAVKRVSKSLSGSTDTSGALSRITDKILTGELTPTGSQVRTVRQLVSGAISVLTGAIVKGVKKVLSGEVTSSSGLSGLFIPGGGGGPTTYFRTFTGDISSIVGALVRKTSTTPDGALAPVGTMTRTAKVVYTGSIASDGAIGKRISKVLIANINTVGQIVKRISKTLSGIIALAGALSASTGGRRDETVTFEAFSTSATLAAGNAQVTLDGSNVKDTITLQG